MTRTRIALSLALAMAVLIGSATLTYRAAYGSWWQTPNHIGYCGRTYLAGATDHMSFAEVKQRARHTALPGDAPYPLVTVETVPPIVGRPVLAAVTPEAERHLKALPCAMELYLNTGNHTYSTYTISGSP